MATFPDRLKELRLESSLTQKQMAEFLNITEQYYQRHEYGKVKFSQENLIKLADYFNVSTDYLLGRSDVPDFINNTQQSPSVIASRLNECRKAKKVTEEEVAEHLGIPVSLYCKYESEILEPNIPMLNKLAEYFNTSVDYLVGFEPQYSI